MEGNGKPTYGKWQTEGDQLAAHEEEVEILHLHLGFARERGEREMRCLSPACGSERYCHLLLFDFWERKNFG